MDANTANLSAIVNRSLAALQEAQKAAQQQNKEPVMSVHKPIVVVRNNQPYLDTYANNKTGFYNNALKSQRYTPLITPRTQQPTVKTEPVLLSQSTSIGSGVFTGKVSVPVNQYYNGSLTLRRII
jgi:hypothetical protein